MREQNKRVFLFLQGPMGSFFKKLAAGLRMQGHHTLRVNFNGGDRLHFSSRHAIDYLGTLEEWPDAVEQIAKQYKITDLVVYGDCRPLHQLAIHMSKPLGIQIHVFEEGYFRPDWVTLEQGGVNGNSSLPREPDFYHRYYAKHPPAHDQTAPAHFGSTFPRLARHTISYYVASALLAMRYRNYLTHRQRTYQTEGIAWLWRLAENYVMQRFRKRHTRSILSDSRPYYLVLLQLLGDSQITHHSPYHDMYEFLNEVLNNFAENAPKQTRLVVKNHPLDNGLTRYKDFLRQKARSLGLEDRLIYIDGGHLPTLLQHAHGVVTVNSTGGLSAIHHDIPTYICGDAVYAMDGLVNHLSLQSFWTHPHPPDQALYQAFRHYVLEHAQIYGGFYRPNSIRVAVQGCIEMLENQPKVNDNVIPLNKVSMRHERR